MGVSQVFSEVPGFVTTADVTLGENLLPLLEVVAILLTTSSHTVGGSGRDLWVNFRGFG